VPGYEILEELGKGGMGVVYKARHEQLGNLVALKMILAGTYANDQDVARFLAEAEAVAHLQHPNIVRLLEFGRHEGLPYFTLEFMAGGSLSDKLQKEPLLPTEAARVVEQLARGMAHAHQAGIIHRDLKPANVLLAADGTPKISDFGLVKRVEAGSGITHTGDVMGTPSYMAPEQARGQSKHVGPAVDVYALGAILYECLTGRPPFKGPTNWDTLAQVVAEDPVPPSRLQPKVPRDLETICLKCLRKEPAGRYPSAEALAEDLRRFQAGEPILARPAGMLERSIKWVRRRPALAAAYLASLIAFVALLGGAAYYLYRKNQDQLVEAVRDTELDAKRRQVQELYAEGLQLVQKNEEEGKEDWEPALVKLAQARGLIGEEPELAPLGHKVEQLQKYINGRKHFSQLTDRAHFEMGLSDYLTESPPAIQAAHAQAARKTIAAALAIFGVSETHPRSPTYGPVTLSDKSRQKVTKACYELVLILAETAIHEKGDLKDKDGLHKALLLLDEASGLAPLKSKAYHLQRKRYLSLLGKKAAADQEQKLAEETPAQTALDHFLVGQEVSRRSDQASLLLARNAYKLALKQNPNLFWANYRLAVNYLQSKNSLLGERGAALAHLTTCIRLQPEFPWPYLIRGTAHAALEEFDAAEADFAEAEKLEKARPDQLARYSLIINRGFVCVLQGQRHEKRAKELQEKGKQDQAAAAFKQAETQYTGAAAQFTRAADLRPDSYQAYANLADVYQKQAALRADPGQEGPDQLKKALHIFNQAIAKYPEPNPAGMRAGLYRTRARLHTKLKQHAAALADLAEAIRLGAAAGDKKNVAGDLIEKGWLHYKREEFRKALQALDRALLIDPGQVLAHRWRGEVLLAERNYPEAEAAFDVYLGKGGRPLKVLYLARGVARERQKKFGDALRDYSHALDLDRLNHLNEPGWKPDPELLRHRGWVYLFFNLPELARVDFEKALKVNPKDADTLNGRGFVLARQGKEQEALKDAEQALKLGTPSTELYYKAARTMAVVAAKSKNPLGKQTLALQAKAVGLLRKALELTPAEKQAQFRRDYIEADPYLESIRKTEAYKLAALKMP
jgi:tetratricopeptide (TPR) repeat protein